MEKITLITRPSAGYELIDSGGEEKLERFDEVVLARPDPQALWEKKLAASDWGVANGKYEREGKEGRWKLDKSDLSKGWGIEFGGLKFLVKPTSFKHTGLFPEQLSNWEWLALSVVEGVKNAGREISVLNIFGYTGGATLAAAQAGASVTHVDASKTAVAWARENAKLNGLEPARPDDSGRSGGDKPIRWITDDAITFLKREIKRGVKYDAVIMDPPAFGHGPDGEVWKFEENFLELLKLVEQVLSEKPLFVLVNGYAAGYSPLAFAYNLESFVKKFGGSIEYGDLSIAESNSERVLPCGIFARWSA